MVKICLSCRNAGNSHAIANKFGKVFNNKKNISAKWAKEYGFINNTPPIGYQRLKQKNIFNQKTGNKTKLDLGKKFANRYIYVWAALPIDDSLLIKNAKSAYFSNKKINDVFGKLDKNGCITIKIRNPQVYKEEGVFPPHLHYKVANKDGTDFTVDFFTKTYLRKINYNNLLSNLKKENYLVLNSLANEYFIKYYIPGSYNLYYKKCKSMTKENVDSHIKDILINYPKILNKVKKKKIALNNIPIIVYCANPTCNAAKYLANSLLAKNFVNILYYSGGLKEYYKKQKNVNLF